MSNIFAIIFAIHLIFNIEKFIFINEFYSLIGFLILFFAFISLKSYNINRVFGRFYPFILYTSLHFFISLPTAFATGAISLRTYPVYYSAFSIFLGIYLYACKKEIFKIFGKITASLAILAGGVLSNPIAVILSSNKKLGTIVLLYMFGLITFKNVFLDQGSSTIVLNFSLLLLVIYFRDTTVKIITAALNPFFVGFLAIIFIASLILLYPTISPMAELGLIPFDFIDPNNLWRILFWSKSVSELWSEDAFLLGKGLGVPLFDYASETSKFLIDANPDDVNLSYTIGLHNSFLYLLIRYGVIGFLLFLFPLCFVLKKSILMTRFNGLDGVVLLSLIFMLINAFFNVILESPLYSSLFWILLGYCCSMIVHKIKYSDSKRLVCV